MKVEITGADARHLEDQGELFKRHYNKIILEEALQPVADRVETLAKSFAPKLSGFMADTIEQKESFTKHQATIRVRPNYREYDEYFYAPVQEYGSEKRNIQATRYMRRAGRAVRGLLQTLLAKASDRAIRTYEPQEDKRSGV